MTNASALSTPSTAFLRSLWPFSSMTDGQWGLVSPCLSLMSLAEDTLLIAPDIFATALYGILEGSVRIQATTPFGTQLFGRISAGDLFGEIAFLDDTPLRAEITTAEPTRLWRLSYIDLRSLKQADLSLACLLYRGFWRSLAHKIQDSNGQMQQFFSQALRTPQAAPKTQAASHSRPAWFAPPEGLSFSSGVIQLERDTSEEKRKALSLIGLASFEIDLFLELGEELLIPAESSVFREGDFGDALYVVLQGRVRISKRIPGIGEEALAILESGQFFGEMALVSDNAIRSADCTAHEGPALLLSFRQHQLHAPGSLAEKDLLFLQALCKMMVFRLRENYDKLFNWRMMSGGF